MIGRGSTQGPEVCSEGLHFGRYFTRETYGVALPFDALALLTPFRKAVS